MRLSHVDDLNAVAAQATRIELRCRNLIKLRVGRRQLMRCHTAEYLVINKLLDGRLFTTNRTLRILSQSEFAKLHAPRIEVQETIDKKVFSAENDLDRFVSLNRADDARQNTKHSAFRARRNKTRRR